jgi:hypothetical protein
MGRLILAGLVVAALAACNDMPTASNDASALTPSMDRKDNPSNDPARCTSGSCAWIDRDFGCHLTLRTTSMSVHQAARKPFSASST